MRLARDPIFYTNLVAAIVMFVSTFLFPLSPEQQGVLNALAFAVAGAISMWKVADGQLALVVGLFKAGLAVAVAFGLDWDENRQLVFMTLVTAVGSAFVRTQVAPAEPPPAVIAQRTIGVNAPTPPPAQPGYRTG